MKLYEIPTEYDRAIITYNERVAAIDLDLENEEITESEAEVQTEEATDVLGETMESLGVDFVSKAENVAKLLRNLEAEADVERAKAKPFQDEVLRYVKRAKGLESNISWLKGYLLHQMQRMDLKKVEGLDLKVARQRNGQPKIVEMNIEKVPSEFLIPQPPKVDRKTALEEWKAHDKSPGAIEGLEFEVGEHIRIR